jgi:hypothetical protein
MGYESMVSEYNRIRCKLIIGYSLALLILISPVFGEGEINITGEYIDILEINHTFETTDGTLGYDITSNKLNFTINQDNDASGKYEKRYEPHTVACEYGCEGYAIYLKNASLSGHFDENENKLFMTGRLMENNTHYYSNGTIQRHDHGSDCSCETEPAFEVALDARYKAGKFKGNLSDAPGSNSNTFYNFIADHIKTKSSISGHVFNDTNCNALWDSIESGLAEWIINLDGVADDGFKVALNASTNINGYYEFKDIPCGTYQLSEVMKYDPSSFMRWNQTLPTNKGNYSITVNDSDITDKNFGNHLTSILELYDNLDLDGANFQLGNLNGYYANARMSKVVILGGGRKIKPIGYVDGKAINIDTYDEAIVCGEYQFAILNWLDAIRSSNKLNYLLEGVDYGPIGINKYPFTDIYFHYAVVLYLKGTNWMQTSIVLDPWYSQKAKIYSIEEYNKWNSLRFAIEPDNGNYAGQYPLTGGNDYKFAPKAKPKQFNLKDKTQVLVHCPVDILITDQQGEKLGVYSNGTIPEEITSAVVTAHPEDDGSFFWYFAVPSENEYLMEITGRENGSFNLLIRHGVDPLRDYGNQLLSRGEVIHIDISPGNLDATLTMAEGKNVHPAAIKEEIPA